MKIMNFKEIIDIIALAGSKKETVEIYYSKTENSSEGWREIEPYSLAMDVGPEGEHIVYGKEHITSGHILNGYTVNSKDDHIDSFILGKIKKAKLTGKKFNPRNNWNIEF